MYITLLRQTILEGGPLFLFCSKQYWEHGPLYFFFTIDNIGMWAILFLCNDKQYWNMDHYISVLRQTILERGTYISILRQPVLKFGPYFSVLRQTKFEHGRYIFSTTNNIWNRTICYDKLFLHMDLISALQQINFELGSYIMNHICLIRINFDNRPFIWIYNHFWSNGMDLFTNILWLSLTVSNDLNAEFLLIEQR